MASHTITKDTRSPFGRLCEAASAKTVPDGVYTSSDATCRISPSGQVELWSRLKDTSLAPNDLKFWEYENGTQTLILGWSSGPTIRFQRGPKPVTLTGAQSTGYLSVSESSPQNGSKTSAKEVQIGGNHYKNFKLQPAEFIHMNDIGFLEGNVIKYVCRHAAKHGAADLLKARHYIDLLLELQYGGSQVETAGMLEVSKPATYGKINSAAAEESVGIVSDGPLHSVRSAGTGDY